MIAALQRRARGFSLIELVIVVVILGIIGAIAIPRMSRGAEGAAESALAADLAKLRTAIDLYQAEHDGDFPSAANIELQLTQFTDVNGNTNATRTTEYIYGPYLRQLPPLPVGANRGSSGIAAADAEGVGWIYDEDTGEITANTTDSEVDARGRQYNEY